MTTAKERGERGHTMPNENETPTQGAPAEQERTFTQTELDAIVRDRLKREREKYADYADLQTKAKAYDEAKRPRSRSCRRRSSEQRGQRPS